MVLAAALAVFTRLLPEEYRLWNFAAIGAMGLFAGARIRAGWAFALPLVVWMITDVVIWWKLNGEYPMFSPLAYVGLLGYVVLGLGLLRRTENPFWIGGTAGVASLQFFLISNLESWLNKALPEYQYTLFGPGGYLYALEKGLPFYRGTIAGDLMFTALFFGAYALLTRLGFNNERVNQPHTSETI
jgi:hypothetical protein